LDGHSHLVGQGFQNLHVFRVERAGHVMLDIEHAKQLSGDLQRQRQLGSNPGYLSNRRVRKRQVTRVVGHVAHVSDLPVRRHPPHHALLVHSETAALRAQRPSNFAGAGAGDDELPRLIQQEDADVIVTVVFLDQRADLIEQRFQIENGGDILRHVDGGLQGALDALGGAQRLFQFDALVLILHAQALDTHVSAAVNHVDQQRYRQSRYHREGKMRPGRVWSDQQRHANPTEDRHYHDQSPPGRRKDDKSGADQ